MATVKRKASDGEAGPIEDVEGNNSTKPSKGKEGSTTMRQHQRRHNVTFGMGDAHYRTLYEKDPDFRQLTQLDAAFASKYDGPSTS